MLPSQRVLGVLWKTESDTLGFDSGVKEKPITRRGLLSVTSSIYDPLGFICPFVLKAKILFQTLCRQGWDDPMSHDMASQWQRWPQDLPLIERMSIPRCVKPDGIAISTMQLHHFADASERAYGAVSYLRLVDIDGKVHCSFLMAKSKLAPLRATTIPRLELAAAVVAVKLDQIIRHEMQLPLMESVFWSDSMIVLQYLRNENRQFQTYVANRVTMIHEQSSPSQWRHVDSALNPADDVSRGTCMTAQQLVNCDQWFSGPPFLLMDEDAWPKQPDLKSFELSNDAEVKRQPQVYVVNSTVNQRPTCTILEDLFTRYSSWYKLKKAVGWILRTKSMLHQKVAKGHDEVIIVNESLTVKELLVSEKAVVRYVQQTSLGDTQQTTSRFRKLNPIISSDDLVCVGGRLENATIPV